MARSLRPTTVKYYIGIRRDATYGDARITLLVPGEVDDAGEARTSLETARAVEAVLHGGDYHGLEYLAEPVAETHTPDAPICAATHVFATGLVART